MKRYLCFMLAAVMLLMLAACGAPAAPVIETAPPAAADAAPAEGGDAGEFTPNISCANTVEVSTVDEFLAAIASDTMIVLAAGNYDLSTASDYGRAPDGAPYIWTGVYDSETESLDTAFELAISNVDKLAIVAAPDANVTISAVPRYANVLSFYDCGGILLRGVTVGHTEEPGVCAGGVLMLNNVRNAAVQGCYLYGCGTVGIQAYNCRGVSAAGTHIFDCSESAVMSSGCTDVRLDDCSIYDCGLSGYAGLFSVDTTTGFAVLNSTISNCTGGTLLMSGYSRGVCILGCAVNGSTAFDNALFAIASGEVTVDDSSFDDGLYYPLLYAEGFEGRAVTSAGEEITADMLVSMQRAEAVYDGPDGSVPTPEIALDASVNAEGERVVHVKTVDELLAAIAPDTTIYLDSDFYDLSAAADYGGAGGYWYGWLNNYDGPGLIISGVENLTIISENGATISAVPRYADVIQFSGCTGITLRGVTAGHTEEPGECSGGVLNFQRCNDILIDACRLYGCGIVGVSASDSSSLTVKDTEIYECSNAAVTLWSVSGAVFDNCNIYNCGTPELVLTDSSTTYNGTALKSLDYSLENGVPVEYVYPGIH